VHLTVKSVLLARPHRSIMSGECRNGTHRMQSAVPSPGLPLCTGLLRRAVGYQLVIAILAYKGCILLFITQIPASLYGLL
jgi:hypothetical protein